MSVLLVSYCMAAPKPLVQLLKLLDRIRFYILSALFYLISFSFSNFNVNSGGIDPQPPRSADVDPSFIKSQLPLIEFSNFISQSPETETGAGAGAASDQESCACVFCLEKLEAEDRVRELRSCRHSFHGGCIDKWIDLGQLTCPTCRADLLPKWIRIKERLRIRCLSEF